MRNPNTTTANRKPAVRYRHQDGTEHELIVRDTPDGYLIVDCTPAGQQETLVEELDRSDGKAAAVAIARDYATTHSP